MMSFEKEEFGARMSAMSDEEKEIAVKFISSDCLIEELKRRMEKTEHMVSLMKSVLAKGTIE